MKTVKLSKEQLKALSFQLNSIFYNLDIEFFEDINKDNVFKFVGACEVVFEKILNNDLYYIE